MKYNLMLKIYGKFYSDFIKKDINDRSKMKAVKKEYRKIMERADDIGANNNLLSSYSLGAFFISCCRNLDLSPEEIFKIIETNIKKSKMFKSLMGDAKSYVSEKRRAARREWSKETKERKYKNDWVVDIKEDDPNWYEIDYHECGVCKLFKQEGCFELAKYLCKLDFVIAEVIGLDLHRSQTLAEGGSMCDFRYKIK